MRPGNLILFFHFYLRYRNPNRGAQLSAIFRDLDDIKKVYMLGASSYHVKPTSLDELRQQVKVLHDYWLTCQVPKWTAPGADCARTARASWARDSHSREARHLQNGCSRIATGTGFRRLRRWREHRLSRPGALRPNCILLAIMAELSLGFQPVLHLAALGVSFLFPDGIGAERDFTAGRFRAWTVDDEPGWGIFLRLHFPVFLCFVSL